MVMEVIDKEQSMSVNWFPMHEMKSGQVCCTKDKEYVLKVTHVGFAPIFLILENNSKTNSYQHNCSILVRNLHKDESITVKFS